MIHVGAAGIGVGVLPALVGLGTSSRLSFRNRTRGPISLFVPGRVANTRGLTSLGRTPSLSNPLVRPAPFLERD